MAHASVHKGRLMRLDEITKDEFKGRLGNVNYAPIVSQLSKLKDEFAVYDLTLNYEYDSIDKTFTIVTRIPYKTHKENTNRILTKANKRIQDVFYDKRYTLDYKGIEEKPSQFPDTYIIFEIK